MPRQIARSILIAARYEAGPQVLRRNMAPQIQDLSQEILEVQELMQKALTLLVKNRELVAELQMLRECRRIQLRRAAFNSTHMSIVRGK